MKKGTLAFCMVMLGIVCGSAAWLTAQQDNPDENVIRKVVSMVQLNVAVTDNKGHYVTNLHPSDFVITEDGIPQQIASFDEGNERRNVGQGELLEASNGPQASAALRDAAPRGTVGSVVNGADVFILFDTSNYMYRGRGFVFAQDSIAEFVRSLDNPDRVAFYSYSRDLSREALLTSDRSLVLRGVRATVNGDDSALYNALLLTLKDAARQPGRKVVVVFSNGPDNSSMVPPEDVAELAQSEGIPIYMVSTRDARLDPVSAAVFGRVSTMTGGVAHFAKNWKEQQQAFDAIREDLAHLYFMSYYPQPNPNRGWRSITVKLKNERLKKYKIRTRNGYRPVPERVTLEPGALQSGQ